MKVYVATSGEYSDYHILKIFTREEDANAYQLGDNVEEYELHDGPVETRLWWRLSWDPTQPDEAAPNDYYGEGTNPWECSDRRDFDGHPNLVQHRWTDGIRYDSTTRRRVECKVLYVEGWDIERVRKVYSEQRAQHIARQDMGVEGSP